MRILVFVSFILISIFSFAQKTPQIKKLEQQRKQTLMEISNTDKLLSETKKNTTSLLDRINLIANQIFSRQKVLELLGQEIQGIDAEQKKIEAEIVVLEADLKDKQKNYAKAVDGMLRNRQSENRILFVLSGKSLTESYRRLRYLRDYSEWRSAQADEIKEKSDILKEKKEALGKTKTEKSVLLSQQSSEQKKLKSEEENYKTEVNEAQQKQKDLQKILAQKKKQAEALDRQIDKLIAEDIARQEREARRIAEEKARASAKKDKNGKAKPSITLPSQKMTQENVVLSNSFVNNKGKLPYPISGNYTITTRYGNKKIGHVTLPSTGLKIRSQAGAVAKAVFDGEVASVAAIQGNAPCIIIRHGGYYSFYGNLQNINVKQGDKVTTGQPLGTVYTDPDTGICEIEFRLMQGTNKLNPEPWLR